MSVDTSTFHPHIGGDRDAISISPETFTQIPNWFFPLIPSLTGDELKVGLYLFRLIKGWHRKEAIATYNQIAQAVNASRRSVINAVKTLLAKGIFHKTTQKHPSKGGFNLPNVYAVGSSLQSSEGDCTQEPVKATAPQKQRKLFRERKEQARETAAPSLLACTDEPPNTPPNQVQITPEQQAQALAILQGFKESLRLDGAVGPALVREVLSLVELPDLPSALKQIDDRIRLRRKRNPREYSRIGIGFVVTVLREDVGRPTAQSAVNRANRPALQTINTERFQKPYSASLNSVAPLPLSDTRKTFLESRRAVNGFVKAGTVLASLLDSGQCSEVNPCHG